MDEIKYILSNPPKPSFWTKIKIKYSRWKQKRRDLKEYKKYIKLKKEMED
jgi:hypothetical protein